MLNTLTKTMILFTYLLVGLSINAQTTWEIEREKEHGILRVKIEGLSLDDYYYFVYQNPQTNAPDTLRNREMHLDLGNNEAGYSYGLGKILKALPPGLYGKKETNQHIYDNWYHVSFPVLGLSKAQIVVKQPATQKSMRIHFNFNSRDTADYVFQLDFQEGDYFIEASLLKHYALSNRYPSHRSLVEPDELIHTPYNHLSALTVMPSQTENTNLSIVNIGKPEALRCVPFHDRMRYSSPLASTVKAMEHPYYKKIKYHTALGQSSVPVYMKADSSDDSLSPYCVENTYVKPLYLYSDQYYKKGLVKTPNRNLRINRRSLTETEDTTFIQLESYIEAILFSADHHCNQPYYSVTEVAFPFNSDSLVSIEVVDLVYPLPLSDAQLLMKYKSRLKKEIEKDQRPRSWGPFSFLKRIRKPRLDSRPYMPQRTLSKRKYDVEIPQACDTFIHPRPSMHGLNNGYYSWEAVKPCYKLKDTAVLSKRFLSLVVNPYTMKGYDPEVLFGPRFRDVVYTEILKEQNRILGAGEEIEFNFNEHHYKPELKRHFRWGLDREHVIIYYGDEGEFWAYRKLFIPFERFE